MPVELVYAPALEAYRFTRSHPLVPERFSLAVDLMAAWDLLTEDPADGGRAFWIAEFAPARSVDLERVHDSAYLEAVRIETGPSVADELYGLGEGDTPRFPRMHEAAALACGATIRALDDVVSGAARRAFAPAGGLHHAHHDRAAGFCVYNDCAIAIAKATAEHPGLRVAYVDIDAHHGDGVQEAFLARCDVLTVSVHESGRYLYPGTGAARDIGEGEGKGFAINVPLPPHAEPDDYARVFQYVVEPALSAFGPDVIVAQLGADAHRADPLTHLRLTVAGHTALVRRLVAAADALCGGRIVATGGGGYDAYCATPRAWASAMAVLLGVEVPEQLPPAWLERAATAARSAGATGACVARTFDELTVVDPPVTAEETSRLVDRVIGEVRAYSPLLGEALP